MLFFSSFLLAIDNPFAKFGVTSVAPLIANSIAFLITAFIVYKFALTPIKKMLEERKQRIIESEEQRQKNEETWQHIEESQKSILLKANEEGNALIKEAQEAAQKLLEQKQAQAALQVEEILEKSRQIAAQEAEQSREELRAEFSRLVAQATTQVTGKILTPEDKKRLNEETLNAL